MPTKTFQRRHRAKLTARLGPAPFVADPRFEPWLLHTFGLGPRPATPKHMTQAEHPGFFEERARLLMWRQRKHAGVPRPALGLWKYGRVPEKILNVSRALDAAGTKPPTPKPPSPPPSPVPNPQLVKRAQRVMFTAWRPLDGRGKRSSVTADLNVGGNPGQHVQWCQQVVAQNKAAGLEPSVWGNQSQVGIDHMRGFAAQLGVPYIIWQAETVGEMTDVGVNPDGSIRPGSPVSQGDVVEVGNANAWTDQQRATVISLSKAGRFAHIQETYTNEGDPWPEAYGTQGVPAASICPGVGWGRYPHQLPAYQQHTSQTSWASMCPYIPETFDGSSWAVMPW